MRKCILQFSLGLRAVLAEVCAYLLISDWYLKDTGADIQADS